jgi:hypothetical protein
MNQRLKRLLIWGCIGAIGYFLLSHHIVFVGSNVRLLKKSQLTLEDTFYSTQGKSWQSVLSNDRLRRDGIGKLLVEMGKLTEEELKTLEEQYEKK